MDLGTVTFERPSLNLVRDAEGDWNVAEWLPRITNDSSAPATTAAPAATSSNTAAGEPQPYVRFDRILFDDGRINFKRADEKIPFALTEVTGSVEPDAPGRWRIDLEAVPTRAAVPLQQPGLVHVAAQVGGTSSRFRPVTLALSWQEGSVSDLLRLTRGYDFGVRGDFSLAVNARATADDWTLETRTSFRSLHRWDMTLRPDNPDFNVLANFTVHPQASGFDIEHAMIEAPHSRADATAHISWTAAPTTAQAIALASGEPMREITGAAFDAAAAPSTIEITAVAVRPSRLARLDPRVPSQKFRQKLRSPAPPSLPPLSQPPPRALSPPMSVSTGRNFWLSASHSRATHFVPIPFRSRSRPRLRPPRFPSGVLKRAPPRHGSKSASREIPGYHVSGAVDQVRDLVAAASALGWPISRGWDVAGPAASTSGGPRLRGLGDRSLLALSTSVPKPSHPSPSPPTWITRSNTTPPSSRRF